MHSSAIYPNKVWQPGRRNGEGMPNLDFSRGKDKEFGEMKVLEDGSSDRANTQDGQWFSGQWLGRNWERRRQKNTGAENRS